MPSKQSVTSVLRQVLALLGIVFGVLTQSVGTLHLPTALSSILAIGGTVILAIEHYVADPSTGTTNAPTPTVTVTPVINTAPPSLP